MQQKGQLMQTEQSKLNSFTNKFAEVTPMLSKFNNVLKTSEAENLQDIKNSQPHFKLYWLLYKKSG